jgi:hypothetical protein
MSYDVWFWKQTADCTVEPARVMERLADGEQVPGIVPIDIQGILAGIRSMFPAVSENRVGVDGGRTQLIWQSSVDDGCFIVGSSPYYVSVESHGANSETLNRLIELAVAFDCRLYDPQTGVRYDG